MPAASTISNYQHQHQHLQHHHHHLDKERDTSPDQSRDQDHHHQDHSHLDSYIYPDSYSHYRSISAHSSTTSLTSPSHSLRSFSSLSTLPPPLFKPGCDMTTANNESFSSFPPPPPPHPSSPHDRQRLMEGKSFAASLDPGFETDTLDDEYGDFGYDGGGGDDDDDNKKGIAGESNFSEGYGERLDKEVDRGTAIIGNHYGRDMTSFYYGDGDGDGDGNGNRHIDASSTTTRTTRTMTDAPANENDSLPPQNHRNSSSPSSPSLQHQSMHRQPRQGSTQIDSGFPQVQPGGSLLLAWQVRGKNVFVIGGGKVAGERTLHALNADAKVTVISPSLNPEVTYRVSQGQIRHINRNFTPSDLDDNVHMVLIAIDDPQESLTIWHLCKEKKIPVNVADVPDECDFYFGSVYRDGPLQVMVSTNGNGPKMANLVKGRIRDALPEDMGAAIRNVGVLRSRLRKIASAPEEGPKRMKWISKFCEQWPAEELVKMDEQDIDEILGFYESNTIPTPSDIRRRRDPSFSDSSTLTTSTPSVRPRLRTSTGVMRRSDQAQRHNTTTTNNRNLTPSHLRSHLRHRLHHRTSSVPSSIPRYTSYHSDGNTTLSTLRSVSTNMRTDSSVLFEDEGEGETTATTTAAAGEEEEEEYPLVLLHCTLLPPSLCLNPSLPFPSEQALRDALPEKYFRRWKILEDKVLASGVLRDRGMLVSHPEDDYSLLEERIFESLDLSSHSRPDDRDRNVSGSSATTAAAATGTGTTSSPGDHTSINKRKPFDLRIYAANGLMRSGAWRAAWREMEKVDVEICLSLPGDVRRGLEKRIMEEMNVAPAAAAAHGGPSAVPLPPPPHPPSSPLPPHSALGYGIGMGMSSRPLSPVTFDGGASPVMAKSQEVWNEQSDVGQRKTIVRRTAEVIRDLFADGRNCAMLGMGILVCYMAMQMQTSQAKDD